MLLEREAAQLEEPGLRVLRPVRLPPNDGGISYGQAAVAAAARTGIGLAGLIRSCVAPAGTRRMRSPPAAIDERPLQLRLGGSLPRCRSRAGARAYP